MTYHPRALGLGDLTRPVRGVRIDDQDLVEQRHAPDHLAHRAPDDRPDGLLFVQRRQHEADREPLLLLERHEPAQVGELAVVEIRLAEPAFHLGRDRAGFLGGAVGGGERFGPGGQPVEGGPFDRVARLDDDDRRLGPGGDRLRQGPE